MSMCPWKEICLLAKVVSAPVCVSAPDRIVTSQMIVTAVYLQYLERPALLEISITPTLQCAGVRWHSASDPVRHMSRCVCEKSPPSGRWVGQGATFPSVDGNVTER